MIWIDGTAFEVDYTRFDHKVDIDRMYKLITADGVKHRRIAAIYHSYSLTLSGMSSGTYAALMQKLTENTEFHTVVLPDGKDGHRTFEAVFEGVSDQLVVDNDTDRLWDNITITFEDRRPA